jgi:uncharacterized C2H2 Zn-finger protein
MKCPLCQRIFVTEKELVEHCAACDGEETRWFSRIFTSL